jgi:tight adherence protein B
MNQLLLFTVVTFLVVTGLIFGPYWYLVVRPEQATRTALRRRLRSGKVPAAVVDALMKDEDRMSAVPAFDRILSQRANLVAPLARLIEQSGLRVTVGAILLMSAVIGMVVYVVAMRLTGLFLVGAVLGVLCAMLPTGFVKRARNKRVRKFEELFPEAVDLIARSLRAGHAFTTGLAMVADELPDPVGREFKLLYDQQNYGMPLPDALRAFGQRIPLLDARFFVTAVLTQRDAGGNLSEVLDNLSSVIRDRFKVKREVRTKSAHGRMTGWVLALLPPFLAAALFYLDPRYITDFARDPTGMRMIVGAIILQVIGTLVIRRIVDIEY